jgi:uncharacterized repeat protein (TIGR01451 family)
MFSLRRSRSARRSSQRRARQAFLGRAASRFFPLRLEALEPRLVLDGASLVQDLLPGPESSHPFIVGNVGDTVFFSAGNDDGTRSLWTVSGSQDPVLFANLEASAGAFELDGTLYFGASNGVHGHELWRTDGTAAGTTMVKDIREGQFGSFSGQGFALLDGEVYFSAFHPDYGSELWKTDGTEAGTALVRDIMPGAGGSEPREIVAAGGLVFFQANDGASGREVWRTDGTEQGTLLIKDVFPGSGNSFRPEELTVLGSAVFFRHGNLTTGEELWRTDGSEAGTVIVRDIYPGQTCRPAFCFSNHSRPEDITAIGDLLYFSADSAVGRELYKSDGTEAGTVLIKDIYPGTDGLGTPFRSNPTDFTALGGSVYFFTEHFDEFGQSELWKTDGTEAGTVQVKNLNPVERANAFRLTAIGQSLYFVACGDVTSGDDGGDPANCEPWVSDGTEAGTMVLHDINPGLGNSSPQGEFMAAGGAVFFNADDGEHGAELWRTGLAVASGADLEITISDSPDPVLLGELLTYTITVTNHGPEDASGVVVTASAPGSADFNSVMVPLGFVLSGETRSLELSFTPTAEGSFTAVAAVLGGEDDPDSSNNSDSESTLVQKPIPPITIELASATLEVSESQTEAVVTVTRTGPLDTGTASVEFTTVSGTAGARGIRDGLSRIEDYTTTSGTLFFKRGQISREIRIPIRDDAAIEGDESFQVVLSNPSANARLGEIASSAVTIQDNDPSINFAASSSEAAEGNARSKVLPINVTLSQAVIRPVTVTYTVTGGTATFGQDFAPQTGTLTFGSRATTRSIPLQIIGDTIFELDETVVIELSNPVGAFLGGSTRHRVTIKNDDPQPPPPDPGSTPATSLAIDLQTLPRQSFSHSISRTDVETFRVELGANEQLILDLDPSSVGTALPSSIMTILADDGVSVLNTIGASAEPEGGRVTNNPATLFQADADGGTYFVRLATTATAKGYGYTLHFHRIGVSEEVPTPELLNVPGPMYAWFDGVNTVGVTGPTGYGFTLDGAWQQTVTTTPKSSLRSQTLFLPSGSQFTMKSPQGVELPLLANGPIVITTAIQRWGNIVGRVTTQAIDFPVSLAIAPINDLMADAIGSEFLAFGLLAGQWRISLGANVLNTGRNTNAPVDEMLSGIPYLRQKGPIRMNANLGGFSLDYSVIETPIEWIFDPADPMLYVKADKVGDIKEAALAVSLHGLIEFTPQDAPDPQIDAGVTEFFGHIYGTGKVPFKIGPLPMEVEAEIVANVDADRDGKLLGDLRDVDELFDVLQGDFSEVREIINDVQLGANGTLIMTLQQKKEGDTIPAGTYTMESGRASVVLDGLEETIWVRAQQGGDLLSPDWLKRLNSSASIVTEGLITWDGDFFLSSTTSYSAGGIDFEYEIGFTHEGIFARIRGSVDWSVKFEYQGVRVSGTAIAELEANVFIEFDEHGVPHFSGSVTASGKLRYKGTNIFSGSIEALVRDKGFRFRFPKGVGGLDLDIFG